MTISSSRSDGPRHVGRIVDPSVREDGETEPDLQLSEASEADQQAPKHPDDNPTPETIVSSESSSTDAATPRTATTPQQPASDSNAAVQHAPTSGETVATTEDSAAAGPPPDEPPAETEQNSTPAEEQPASPPEYQEAGPPVSAKPEAQLASDDTAHAQEPPAWLHEATGTGHPVRDKLLARARAARSQPTPSAPEVSVGPRRGLGELDGFEAAKSPRETELDRVGTPLARPAAGLSTRREGALSPNMVAVFGSLIGLATVASLIALSMNLDAEHRQQAVAEDDKAAPAASAAPAKRPAYAVKKRVSQKLPGPWRITDAKQDSTTRIAEGKIGTKAFLVAVADAGIKQKEAYRLLIAYKGLRDLDNCDRSHRFRALVERGSGRLKAFEYIVSTEEVYQAREDKDGYLKAKRLDLKVARRQVKGAFLYDGESIKASSADSGFEKGLRTALSKAIDGHSSIDELTRGDRLRVIAQEVTVLGEFARYAGIEAVEVLPKNEKDKPLRIYYFHHARAGGYYNARGQAPYEGGWRKPIKDAPITSKFNPKRLHPVLKKVMPHNGTDFGAATGTPIGASSYGIVSFIGPAGASGNLVKVDHPGGIETGYAHLSRFAEGLNVGDKVKRLQLIGYVGSTGRSTGPHLHFSAKKDGKFIDPESLNLDGMRVIPSEFRGEFEAEKIKYDKLLNTIPLPPPFQAPKEAIVAKPTEPAPAPDPGAMDDGEEDGSEMESPANDDADEAESSQAPSEPREPATPAAKAASAVYLTDKELLEMQSVTDDGEVSE